MPGSVFDSRSGHAGRLTSINRNKQFFPWVRAYHLEWCFLYWIPVDSFPIPTIQHAWLMRFIDELVKLLSLEGALRPEIFLQLKTLHPHLVKPFLASATKFVPLLGLMRRPGVMFSEPLTEQDIQDMIDGRKNFSFNEYVADYAYWFVDKSERLQRELFLGMAA
jgi:hypothetical protein